MGDRIAGEARQGRAVLRRGTGVLMHQEGAREALFVGDEYAKMRKEHSTGLELYFGRNALPAEAPIYVFQHTMKTGGTALRALIYCNLRSTADYVTHEVPKRAGLAARYRALYGEMAAGERARLLWAVGHAAAFLAPLLDRPARIVTIAREPVDRVISRHAFAGRGSVDDGRRELLDELWQVYTAPDSVASKRWRRARAPEYSNFQSRSIMAPFHDVKSLPIADGPPPDADVWRQRLFSALGDSSILLVQDRLDEGVRRLAAGQQWSARALPRMRVNRARPSASDVDPALRALIERYNWLDVELYRCAVARHEAGRSSG